MAVNEHINWRYMVFLSVVAALGGYLFGYDTAVISGTISQVAKQFSLDTIQQGWYVGCALVGSIIGVLFAGILSDRFGRKNILILSAVLFFISSIGCAVCTNFDQLVLYRIVGGVGIGVVSIVSPLYISEISAAQYRGRLVGLYQLAVTIGFLGAYLVNFALLDYADAASTQTVFGGWLHTIFHTEVWRAMLGMAAIPALLFLITIFFIPESPRWAMLRKQDVHAQKTWMRIYNDQVDVVQREMLAAQQVSATKTGDNWRLILEPGTLKAVIIGAAIAILGQFMGVNAVLYYGPTIFENNGMSGGDSLLYQVLVGLANVSATVIALFIIDKVGRKKLIYYGVSAMIIFLLLIALYFMQGEVLGLSSVFLLVFFMGYIFSCAISISAVIFVLLSEMYPMKVRGLAMSIAGFSLWVGTYLIGQLTPWLLQTCTPTGTFILFAVMCVPYILIIWKLVPETTGKSLEDIERHWIH